MTSTNTTLVQELRHRGHSLLRLYGAADRSLASQGATLDLHLFPDAHEDVRVVMEAVPAGEAMQRFMTERRKLVQPPSGRSVV